MQDYQKVLVTQIGKVGCVQDSLDESALAPNSVLVKTRYSLISAGTELACLKGLEDWFQIPGTPGYCNTGVVVKVGADVRDYREGDHVYTDTGHLGLYSYPADRDPNRLIAKVPEGVPEPQVPYIRMASIALTSANVSDIQLGDRVLVVGLGVVGNFAAQFAKLQGADVLCCEPGANRIEAARAAGLAHFIKPASPDLADEVAAFTDGRGFDAVIEATGLPSVAEAWMPYIARNGELILSGTPRGAHPSNLTEVLRRQHLAAMGLVVKGAHEVRYPTWRSEFLKHSRERNFSRIAKLIAEGRLKVEPLITEIAPPEDAARVYDNLLHRPNETLSVLFDFTRA